MIAQMLPTSSSTTIKKANNKHRHLTLKKK